MAKWRTPKPEDLNGKDFIECQVRNRKSSPWRKARLVRISKEWSNNFGSSFPYAVVLESTPLSTPLTPRFKYCRIKESVESTTGDTTPKVVEYSPGDIVYITIGDGDREKAKVLLCSCKSGECIYRVQSLEDSCQYWMHWHELELCSKAIAENDIQGEENFETELSDNIQIIKERPKFKIGDFVKYNTWLCRVVKYDYNDKRKEYQYEVKTTHRGHHHKISERDLTLHTVQPYDQTGTNEKGYFDDVEGKWVEESNPFDGRTVTNNQGGKQSFVSARFDCIPPEVLRLLTQCLGFGVRKYGKDNWKNIEQWDHLNHAMNHINEWNRGDRSEPHLVNAMARLTFALWQAVDQKQQPDTYIHPDEVK